MRISSVRQSLQRQIWIQFLHVIEWLHLFTSPVLTFLRNVSIASGAVNFCSLWCKGLDLDGITMTADRQASAESVQLPARLAHLFVAR